MSIGWNTPIGIGILLAGLGVFCWGIRVRDIVIYLRNLIQAHATHNPVLMRSTAIPPVATAIATPSRELIFGAFVMFGSIILQTIILFAQTNFENNRYILTIIIFAIGLASMFGFIYCWIILSRPHLRQRLWQYFLGSLIGIVTGAGLTIYFPTLLR